MSGFGRMAGLPFPSAWTRAYVRPALLRTSGLLLLLVGTASSAWAGSAPRTLAPPVLEWPTTEQVVRVLTLADYNTRVVVIGVGALGLAAGAVGTFLLLRKRALLSDTLAHATLPGVGGAFILMTMLGGTGKWMPGLLLGAAITGVLGVLVVQFILQNSRIREDAALGIVLSVFFAVGIVLLILIQNMGTGHAAGLKSFIYGKTASMLAREAWAIVIVALLCAAACALLFKELTLLCFDPEFGRAQGWPIHWLDLGLMILIVVVTMIGLQAVGLILVVALLIIPPAAARFWTEHLPTLVGCSALLGGVSCLLGAALSALFPRLPAGAVIVLVAGALFALSLVFGRQRGLVQRGLQQRRLRRKVERQNLLRALFEIAETQGQIQPAGVAEITVPVAALLAQRSWTLRALRRALRRAQRAGHIEPVPGTSAVRLTARGRLAAWRCTRNHRLWELYLITHADVAPAHVDRDADEVEHVLDRALVRELEAALTREAPELASAGQSARIDLVPPQESA